jgi:hypothetical protein
MLGCCGGESLSHHSVEGKVHTCGPTAAPLQESSPKGTQRLGFTRLWGRKEESDVLSVNSFCPLQAFDCFAIAGDSCYVISRWYPGAGNNVGERVGDRGVHSRRRIRAQVLRVAMGQARVLVLCGPCGRPGILALLLVCCPQDGDGSTGHFHSRISGRSIPFLCA